MATSLFYVIPPIQSPVIASGCSHDLKQAVTLKSFYLEPVKGQVNPSSVAMSLAIIGGKPREQAQSSHPLKSYVIQII